MCAIWHLAGSSMAIFASSLATKSAHHVGGGREKDNSKAPLIYTAISAKCSDDGQTTLFIASAIVSRHLFIFFNASCVTLEGQLTDGATTVDLLL
jgi:hypothetical protein